MLRSLRKAAEAGHRRSCGVRLANAGEPGSRGLACETESKSSARDWFDPTIAPMNTPGLCATRTAAPARTDLEKCGHLRGIQCGRYMALTSRQNFDNNHRSHTAFRAAA